MRKRIRTISLVATAVFLAATACTTEDEAAPEASPEPPSTLVTFDGAGGEFSEGVAVDADGNVFASISPQGRLVKIAAGTKRALDFGRVEGLGEGDLGLLGLTVDAEGNVYGGVVSSNDDARGVWRFDAATGEEVRVPGTEDISFANAVAFDGTTLYITDTSGPDGKGAVWRVEEDGDAEIWAQDDLLAGDGSAGFGFPLGPNGIDVRDDTVYVGLTEPAKIATIAISDDGESGEVSIFADLTKAGPDESPAAVDGIDVDDDGNVYVAAPLVHTIFKVSEDGQDIETVATARDGLDGPASVVIGDDVLYVSNFSAALGEASNQQGPGIVRIPL